MIHHVEQVPVALAVGNLVHPIRRSPVNRSL
jgi:hypothetical protein